MMPESPVEMSIVVPTLGKSPHLRGLLERLQRQSANFTFRVFVVANIPSQTLRKLVNSMGDRRSEHQKQFEYLETGRLGVNLARNKGLERALGSVVLFLDDDIILDSDNFVAEHYERHQKHPEAVAIGGPYQLAPAHSKWDVAYDEIAQEWLTRHRMSHHRTSVLHGGNLSLKLEILKQKHWRFDERIGFGGAETGLCLRIALEGLPLLYFPDLAVGHAPQLTWITFRRKAFMQGAGARWRAEALPALTVQYVNGCLPEKYDRARRIYRHYFNFGWHSEPYKMNSQDTHRTIIPALKLLSYVYYAVYRSSALRSARQWHRDLYALVRAAWLNGST